MARRSATASAAEPGDVPWGELGVEIVLECSGRFRTRELLEPYFEQGVRKVIVAAPVKQDALNLVVGVNDDLYEPDRHDLLTAASCTTNCLAPVVKVIHEGIGIRHGLITTLHDMTNTQTSDRRPPQGPAEGSRREPLADPHDDGSATAIGLIFPELEGRLNGLAVRVPAAERVADGLRLRGGSSDDGGGGQRPARSRRRRARWRGSSGMSGVRWCRSTSGATRARASSTRSPRWSRTRPR